MRGNTALIGLLGLALGGCVAPFPPPAGGGSSTDSTGTTGPSDPSPTTSSPGTTVASLDGTGTTTTTTTTAEETSSTSPDDSGSSSGEPSECREAEDCGANQSCVDGICFDLCGGLWGEGNYGGCLNAIGGVDVDGQCGSEEQNLCITYSDPIEATHCAAQGCNRVCDCPAPPATGNAVVTCGNITFPDKEPDCYLSCANGETCPDGMFCRGDAVCVTAVSDLPMYGNCGNVAANCIDGNCLMQDGQAVCTSPCNSFADCDPAPGGIGDVDCNNVGPPAGPECILICKGDGECPEGMECRGNEYCAWPT